MGFNFLTPKFVNLLTPLSLFGAKRYLHYICLLKSFLCHSKTTTWTGGPVLETCCEKNKCKIHQIAILPKEGQRNWKNKIESFLQSFKKGKESVSSTDWGQNLQKRDWLQTEAAKALRLRWHFCGKSLLQRTEPQRREWYKQDLKNLAWHIFVTMITMTILMFQSSPLLHIWFSYLLHICNFGDIAAQLHTLGCCS